MDYNVGAIAKNDLADFMFCTPTPPRIVRALEIGPEQDPNRSREDPAIGDKDPNRTREDPSIGNKSWKAPGCSEP